MTRKLSQRLTISDRSARPPKMSFGVQANEVLRTAEILCEQHSMFQITTPSILEAIVSEDRGTNTCEAFKVLKKAVGTRGLNKIIKELELLREEDEA